MLIQNEKTIVCSSSRTLVWSQHWGDEGGKRMGLLVSLASWLDSAWKAFFYDIPFPGFLPVSLASPYSSLIGSSSSSWLTCWSWKSPGCGPSLSLWAPDTYIQWITCFLCLDVSSVPQTLSHSASLLSPSYLCTLYLGNFYLSFMLHLYLFSKY